MTGGGPASTRESFDKLSAVQKRRAHFALCDTALRVWLEFFARKRRIWYADSVAGVSHAVDGELPSDAYRSAQAERDLAGCDERYLEPLAALQDFDLELPAHVRYAYYSVYNLFRKYALQEDVDDWLIVNQALSSTSDENAWMPMLTAAVDEAIECDAARLGPERDSVVD